MTLSSNESPSKRQGSISIAGSGRKQGDEVELEEEDIVLQKQKEKTDFFTWLENTRVFMKKQRELSWQGQTYDFILLCLSVLSPLQYIVSTYITKDLDYAIYHAFDLVEFVLGCIFTFDWVFSLFLADNKYKFFTNFYAMVDLMTVIPIWVTVSFLGNVTCVLFSQVSSFEDVIVFIVCGLATTRILRALRIRRRLSIVRDEVDRLFGEICLSAACMVLFDAAIQQYIEAENQPLEYHLWVYQIWITVTTTGYGDIYPTSDLGRMSCIIIVGFSLFSVPQWASELVELSSTISKEARAFYLPKNKMETHVIISGELESISLEEIFGELFHEDHDAENLHAVILIPEKIKFEMVMLLMIPTYSLKLTYLEGSVLLDKDLNRASAESAAAFFIMTNKFSSNPDEEDAKTILQQFSIRRYITQIDPALKPLFCMQIIRPENKRHLVGHAKGRGSGAEDEASKDLVICLNEIKMGVISKAVMFPGTNTLLMNLLTSFADDEGDGDGLDDGDEISGNSWMSEYQKGCSWEIYSTVLDEAFEGVPFSILSEMLYQQLGVVLFALQIEDLVKYVGRVQMILNPAGFVIPKREEFKVNAFVMATDSDHANLETVDASIISLLHTYRILENAIADSIVVNDLKDQTVHDMSDIDILKKKRLPWQELMHRHDSAKKGVMDESYQEERHKIYEAEMKNMYYIRDSIATLDECTIKTSLKEELAVVNNHIIIIGKEMSNLYDLVLPLRAKSTGVMSYIVILYPYDFPLAVWQRINIFEGVFIMRGSALEESDLRRAGVFNARHVVVLGDAQKNSDSSNDGDSGLGGGGGPALLTAGKKKKSGASAMGLEALIDADTIFCYQCVKRMNENANVVIEIVRHANVSYLDPESGINAGELDYKFTPAFAAGQLFISSLLDTIVCQAFYNPDIINVLNQLLIGFQEQKEYDTNLNKLKSSKNQIPGSSLYQIQIPEGLESRTYGSLFKFLAARHVIPLGLYRGIFSNTNSGPKGNRQSFVFTNPPKDTELFTCDKVYVLSQFAMHGNRVTQKKLQAEYENRQREIEYLKTVRGRRKHILSVAHAINSLKDELGAFDESRSEMQDQIDYFASVVDSRTNIFLSAVTELLGGRDLKCVTKESKSMNDEIGLQATPTVAHVPLKRNRRETLQVRREAKKVENQDSWQKKILANST